MTAILGRFQIRLDTAANWAASTTILLDGEFGLETDTRTLRMGDGVNRFTDLPRYFSAADLAALGVAAPAGTIIMRPVDVLPSGYLRCNGAAVSRTTYAGLFAVIGTSHGAGDGTTTFNLPDYRGMFLRGLDLGRGLDTGRAPGSQQADQNAAHTHGFSATTAAGGDHTHAATTESAGNHDHSFETNNPSSAGSYIASTNSSSGDRTKKTNVAGAHTHAVTVAAAAAHTHTVSGTTGSSGATEARPVNMPVCYFIKT